MPAEILFKCIPYDKSLLTLALESGVDGVIVEEDKVESVLALGRTRALAENSISFHELLSKEDEEQAAQDLKAQKTVLLKAGWEIIPVENLLAIGSGELALEVNSLSQAELAAGVLEKGADTIVVLPEAKEELKSIMNRLKLSQGVLELEPAEVTKIQPVGLGHRVCVDTCSVMKTGQGMLVGNSSKFNFLVHAETEANPYVAARPFRINAGGVHSYTLMPGDKTSYLEELSPGDGVLIVDYQGNTQLAVLGRIKTEVRPMLLVQAKNKQDELGTVFLQNAETIRLVRPNGTPVSVVNLQTGDQVLSRLDKTGRHFGMRIQESIEEK